MQSEDQQNFVEIKELFPVIWVPNPVRAKSLVYCDYISEENNEPLILPSILKKPVSIKYDLFESEQMPYVSPIILKMEEKGFNEIALLINNLPQKIHVLYGEDKKEMYLREVEKLFKRFLKLQ